MDEILRNILKVLHAIRLLVLLLTLRLVCLCCAAILTLQAFQLSFVHGQVYLLRWHFALGGLEGSIAARWQLGRARCALLG